MAAALAAWLAASGSGQLMAASAKSVCGISMAQPATNINNESYRPSASVASRISGNNGGVIMAKSAININESWRIVAAGESG